MIKTRTLVLRLITIETVIIKIQNSRSPYQLHCTKKEKEKINKVSPHSTLPLLTQFHARPLYFKTQHARTGRPPSYPPTPPPPARPPAPLESAGLSTLLLREYPVNAEVREAGDGAGEGQGGREKNGREGNGRETEKKEDG